MIAEVVGGMTSGSLALLADAGHMLTDAAAIVMALVAMGLGEREASAERTFGYYRTEVLAAMANAFGLWLIAGWILLEAYHSLHRKGGRGGLARAVCGHRRSADQHCRRLDTPPLVRAQRERGGRVQHVLADLLGSVGVIVSAILILTLDWVLADPMLSVIIALLIVYNTRGLIVRVANVLLEGAPEHIDVYRLCSELEEMEASH